MKLAPRENSLFAILLRKPWWTSAAVAAAFPAISAAALPPAWFVYGAIGGAPFAVISAIVGWRALKAPSASRVAGTLESVRAMGWAEFAPLLEAAWTHDGWRVERVQDAAADLAVEQGGRRGLVSGRRWKVARLGVEPLRELAAARERREAHECAIVVTGEVTAQAQAFARAQRIRIVDAAELARMLPTLGRPGRADARRAAG